MSWSNPRGGMLASCTCPYYEGGVFCKHVWATLLAADAASLTNAVAGNGRLELIHQLDLDNGDLDAYDEDEYGDEQASRHTAGGWTNDAQQRPLELIRRGSSTASAKRGQKKPRPEDWYDALSRMPIAMRDDQRPFDGSRRGADRRIRRAWFVLDIGASFQAGAVVLNLHCQEARKDGAWGKIKELRARRTEISQFPPDDARRLSLALGHFTGQAKPAYGARAPLHLSYQEQYSRIELTPASHELLLPELAAGGRLAWLLASDQPVEEARPLVWDDGEPWRFHLRIDADDRTQAWTIRGELLRGSASAESLATPVLLLSSGIVVWPDAVARLAPSADWRWITLLRQSGDLTVPYRDRQKLLGELWGGGGVADAQIPENLAARVESTPPRGFLTIHAPSLELTRRGYGRADDVLFADVHFGYGESRVAVDAPIRVFVDDEASSVLLRDREAEQVHLDRLAELRIEPRRARWYYTGPGHVEVPPKRLGEIVPTLVAEGWHVEAEGKVIRRAGEFRINVTSGVDWFDLDSAVDFDGVAVALPQLLEAARRGQQFVELGDGSQGVIPAEWLAKFPALVDLAEVEGDRLRFRSSQALLLDALLAEREGDVHVELDRQYRRVRDKLRSFAGVKPREAPPGFRGELRPYQKAGLGWLNFLWEFGLGGCLADDMGLGKTVQVLAWLLALRRSGKRTQPVLPTLVVAPKSLIFNWQAEAERFAPTLSVLNYTGLDRKGREADLAAADLVLTTYGTLRRDVETIKDQPFEYVILDEAQAIKNDQSVSAKACRLLQARRRLALTGTPVENHLGDLWSLFEFLNPGMLGRSAAFKEFARGGEARPGSATNHDDEVEGGEALAAAAVRSASLDALRRGLAPFILRRTKEQVLADLPQKTEKTIKCELLPADRKRYDQLRDHYRSSLLTRIDKTGLNKSRMHVLEALLRLRQAACHPGLLDPKLADKSSAKLDALLELLAEVLDEGHKALVFSQFTSLLALLRRHLDSRGLVYEYLDGRTRDRQARVTRFQNDPECPLFLISLKAGGCGLNLTAADYVFLLDPWWNPAVEAQAIDRAHRIGQQRPVFAYRLLAADTVEEKIAELQASKRSLADAIISGEKGGLANLTADDLTVLLS